MLKLSIFIYFGASAPTGFRNWDLCRAGPPVSIQKTIHVSLDSPGWVECLDLDVPKITVLLPKRLSDGEMHTTRLASFTKQPGQTAP